PLMADAVAPMAAILALTPFATPNIDLVVGATGQVEHSVDRLRRALSQQIAHTVLWDQCLESIQERGITCVLEIGPGNSLSRQWAVRFPGIPVRSIDEFRKLEGVVDWVRSVLGNRGSR